MVIKTINSLVPKYSLPSLSRMNQDSKMDLGKILIFFTFVAIAMPMTTTTQGCDINAERDGSYVTYHDINDLGLAALDNDVDYDLITKVEWFTFLP